MHLKRYLLLTACLLTATLLSRAQSAPTTDIATHPNWPQPVLADVSSPTATVHAFYNAISGPKGQLRDWARVRSLFIPSGRIAFVVPPKNGTHADIRLLNLDEYQSLVDANFVKYGFYDHEVVSTIEQFGLMADVYSTYESRSTPEGVPFARGIKSIELLERDSRWYIVQIFWDSERPGLTLPERFLHVQP